MAYLFASDLHLDARAPAATEAFVQWLGSGLGGAEALYLLGDVFETWVGDDDPDPHHARVCEALRSVARRGLPLFAMHGNRDFLLGAGFEARSGCRLLPDPVVVQMCGQGVLLTHGDLLCTDDLPYQELRSIVRDRHWQQRMLALPLAQRQWLAGAARSGSKAHTARQRPTIMDANEAAVARVAAATGVDWIIHGHTHRPAIHELQVDGRRVRRAVLGAWYDGASVLRFERDGARLENWAWPAGLSPADPSGNGTAHPAP